MELKDHINNEKINGMIDQAYEKYADSHFIPPSNLNSGLLVDQLWSVIPMEHNKETFVNEIKTNAKFSKKWGLKIDQRELSLEERNVWKCNRDQVRNTFSQEMATFGPNEIKKWLDEEHIPTQLITVTYNNQTEESYVYIS